MQTVINVGDEIKNQMGERVIISLVVMGKFGLLIKGTFGSGRSFESYAPYELPPVEKISPWYGWSQRSFSVLANGIKIGDLGLKRTDQRDTVEEYDKEWEHTIEQMREEQAECIN